MRLPVFVINLGFRQERWTSLSESAAQHAPDFGLHRVDAVNGRDPEWEERPGADQERFTAICGRPMLPGEYGCYFSHLKALRAFLDDGSPYGLIVEDDVVFDESSASRITAIVEALPELEVVRIVNHRSSMAIELGETIRADKLVRTLHGPQGSAAAYIVSRDGARKLIDALATMTLPWDVALERFWDHGVSVFSTEKNVLPFSPHVAQSNIANNGYDSRKFPWYRRLGTALFRLSDYSKRVRHVLKRPSETMQSAVPSTTGAANTPLWAELCAGLAVLAMASVVWFESDIYRFAGVALVLAALYRYFRADLWKYSDRPYLGFMGVLCILWAIYVILRLGYTYLAHPEEGVGSSEGIYIFPLLYPSLGAAMFFFVRRPFGVVAAFMAISLLAFTFGVDYGFDSEARALTLLHNNPIHASVAAGFVALCAVPFLLHVLRRPDLDLAKRLVFAIMACATFFVALLAIYSLWSKGVWLAMAIALPLMAVIIAATDAGRWGRMIAIAAVLVAIAGTAANFEMLRKVAGPTVELSHDLLSEIAGGTGIDTALDTRIENPDTPTSERERMMLWANALDIWAQHPVFGAGISWLHEWGSRRYHESSFNLLHNGYLEVAIRYGVSGLVFFALLYAWSTYNVWRAARSGLIEMAAFQAYVGAMIFFGVTLLSNSNIRLALGESYMWMAAGFGFYCRYLLQASAAKHG